MHGSGNSLTTNSTWIMARLANRADLAAPLASRPRLMAALNKNNPTPSPPTSIYTLSTITPTSIHYFRKINTRAWANSVPSHGIPGLHFSSPLQPQRQVKTTKGELPQHSLRSRVCTPWHTLSCPDVAGRALVFSWPGRLE